MEEKKIKVRILPLHNIGGIGNAGDVVWMSEAQAKIYIEEGYVEVVDVKVSPSVIYVAGDLRKPSSPEIMKPKAKRVKK